jgi:hypothetical protein
MDDHEARQEFYSSSVTSGENDPALTSTYRVRASGDGFLAYCGATNISREGKTLALAVEALRAAIAAYQQESY